MESTRRWLVRGMGGGAVGAVWLAACAHVSSGIGGESHFACKADSDCASLPGNQVCFFSDPSAAEGECTDLSAILDAARNAAGGAGSGAGGATSSGAGAGAGGGGTYCGATERATYPEPPTGVPPSTKNVEVVTAMYTIDVGDALKNPSNPPRHYLELGFDLDNVCTVASDAKKGTCRIPSYGFGTIDGLGGIDNALGSLFQTVREQIVNFSSENDTKSLQAGKSNLLVRLQNWNGEANDDQVTVSLMDAAPFDSFAAGAKPKWDGTDAWPVDSNAVNGSVDQPKFRDSNAYITNHQLVATLVATPLRLDIGLTSVQDVKLDLRLSAGFVVCTIVPVESGKWGYSFSNCTVGGRLAADDLVKQLGQFPDPLNDNKPLCRGTGEYDALKQGICSQVDLNHDPTSGPTLACDALSVGFTFTGHPVLLGDLYPVKPIADPCPPDPLHNPKFDCCESIGALDGGQFAACGYPNLDAGPPPSGSGGAAPVSDASTD